MISSRADVGDLTPAIRTQVALLCAAALVVAAYVLLRYGGLWGENDSATLSRAIRSVLETDRLAGLPGWGVYTNGYGYPAIVTFLMRLGDLSLAEVQLFIKPLLTVWLVVPAWLAYRELTTSGRTATLATAILLAQPELLFVILRGTHETFTRGLMLLLLFLLLRSMRAHGSPGRYAALVIAFPLIGYALVTSNNLMAMSFTFALGLTLAFIWGLGRLRPRLAADPLLVKRLALVTTSLLILSVLFLFYIYRPALHGFLLLETMWESASALITGGTGDVVNPYTTVASLWVSPLAYLVLSMGNWMLLVAAGAIWLWVTWRWIFRGGQPANNGELLLWGLSGALAAQVWVGVFVDLSGALGSNLQLRLIPSFALAAAPLVAKYLVSWWPRNGQTRKLVHRALYVGLAIIAFLSVLKATNDPLLSNKWVFYTPGEMRAVQWAGETLPYRQVWLEQDERMFSAARLLTGGAPLGFSEDDAEPMEGTTNFLVSGTTVSRSQRMGLAVPVLGDDLITYDNGQAQMYHRRPATPYQP